MISKVRELEEECAKNIDNVEIPHQAIDEVKAKAQDCGTDRSKRKKKSMSMKIDQHEMQNELNKVDKEASKIITEFKYAVQMNRQCVFSEKRVIVEGRRCYGTLTITNNMDQVKTPT